jgi:putative two-component system response regulator
VSQLESPTTSDLGGSAGRILVVDDLPAHVRLLRSLLLGAGYAVITASDGEEALKAVALEHPDLVLMDILMPKLDGYQVCERLKKNPATRLTPVVLVTALNEHGGRIRGIDAGADDLLTKPFNPHELQARVRSLVRLKRYTDELDSAESVIMSLALTVEARDSYTNGHCQRLAGYATALGARRARGDDDLAALHRGGYLHDIGKIGLSDAVLLKPARLTPREHEEMKQHTVIGDGLCGGLRSLRHVRAIVRHHHEHLDGSGYPDGLRGDAVPLLAQIVGIVDAYDAATTTRPYKQALSQAEACEQLLAEADRGWRRRDLVEAFVALCAGGRLPGPVANGYVPFKPSSAARVNS